MKKTNAKNFLEEIRKSFFYLIAKDIDGKKSVDFGVYGIPETIFVDKNLII